MTLSVPPPGDTNPSDATDKTKNLAFIDKAKTKDISFTVKAAYVAQMSKPGWRLCIIKKTFQGLLPTQYSILIIHSNAVVELLACNAV